MLHEGEIIAEFDGFRSWVHPPLMGAYNWISKYEHTVYMCYDMRKEEKI